jgi:tetratricopeptide (TPR) repeat protein
MSEKKRTAAAKTPERRMTRPPEGSPQKSAAGEHAATSTRDAAAAVPQAHSSTNQFSNFEAAMKLFHARKLREARDLFARAAEGPERDVAQRARLHLAMCDRRLEKPPVSLSSAEDHYNYGVALINARNVAEARATLEKGVEIGPNVDHIHYALALARALSGDLAGAFESLRRAIELEPRNRAIARQDVDFASIAGQPPFDVLLYPEKKGW